MDLFFSISGSLLCLFPLAIFLQMLKPGLAGLQQGLLGYIFAALMAVIPLLLRLGLTACLDLFARLVPSSLSFVPAITPTPAMPTLPMPCAAAGCVLGAGA